MFARGFTLTELLLSIAIIGLVGSISLPVYNSFLARNDVQIYSQSIASTFRRAQLYARSVNQDSVWSVRISANAVVLYKGSAFASRDSSYDENTDLPGTLTASGLSDVTFSRLSGLPSTTGTVTLTTNANETKAIALNAKGMVAY